MRFGTVAEIEAGIQAAEDAGLTPIKINCVVTRDYNDGDVSDLARHALERDWHVRFIELMPLGGGEAAHVALSQFVPSRETRRADRGRPRAPRADSAATSASDESRNFRFAVGARRRGLHQPRERALLRLLQSHAPHGRRKVPPLPAERRRDGREARHPVRRRRGARSRRSSARRCWRSPPATASTRASPPRSAPCSRSAARRSREPDPRATRRRPRRTPSSRSGRSS